MKSFQLVSGVFLFSLIFTTEAHALPAFALREKVSCTLCHTNGSAPHLTQLGFLYRRAGFRFPDDLENSEKDNMAMELTKHLAAGVSVDYQVATQDSATPGSKKSVTDNEVAVREVEIWPLVGAFLGNFSAWSEVDYSPNVMQPRSSLTPTGATTPAAGGVALSMADLRYYKGNSSLFYSFRAGLIAPEGYGASDEWADDAALPLIDTQTGYFNEDTLATPLGAMNSPQLGAEFGVNYDLSTFLTLGAYNGLDGSNGAASGVQSTVIPAMNRHGRDLKAQLDQLFGQSVALTGVYYNGRIELLDPSNALVWNNNYSQERLYGTWFVVPSTLDFLAGGALGRHDYVNSGQAISSGRFSTNGWFAGLNWYVMPHLTLTGRFDMFRYATGVDSSPAVHPQGHGATLLASLPFENSIVDVHYVRTSSDILGGSDNYRLEWRFLF
ncbi:MAG: hypothetical protein ACXWR1_06625 [Bdellovibrionota bacterium]